MNKADKKIYDEVTENKICQLCNCRLGTERHHIRYGSEGRKTYRGNIILLCTNCHQLVHSNKHEYQIILIDIIDKYLKERDANGQI